MRVTYSIVIGTTGIVCVVLTSGIAAYLVKKGPLDYSANLQSIRANMTKVELTSAEQRAVCRAVELAENVTPRLPSRRVAELSTLLHGKIPHMWIGWSSAGESRSITADSECIDYYDHSTIDTVDFVRCFDKWNRLFVSYRELRSKGDTQGFVSDVGFSWYGKEDSYLSFQVQFDERGLVRELQLRKDFTPIGWRAWDKTGRLVKSSGADSPEYAELDAWCEKYLKDCTCKRDWYSLHVQTPLRPPISSAALRPGLAFPGKSQMAVF